MLTAALGTFIANLGAAPSNPGAIAVPPAALQTALLGMTDAIGVMLAARHEAVVECAKAALLQPGDPGKASVLLSAQRARPDDAAFINATAAHAFAMDDVAAGCHPSAILMPALLAEGEARGASGAQVLRAYVAGFEVLSELSQREPDGLHVTGWHPTGLLGPVAVAAAVANLRQLPAEQCQHALAIAASMSGGLMASFGTPTKALHAGRCAQAGLLAVRLASLGVTGAVQALEAPKGLLRTISPNGRVDLVTPFHRTSSTLRILTEGLSLKQYPVCYSTHRLVDAAAALAASPGFDVHRVARIEVTTGTRQAAMAHHHQPRTGLEARYSVAFAVAAGLVARNAGFAQLEPDFFESPVVRAVIAATQVVRDDTPNPEDPIFAPSDRIQVWLEDGRSFASGDVAYARGHARLPLQADDVRRKFLDCARRGGFDHAEALFAQLGGLPTLDDVAALAAPATAPASA